MDMDYGFKKTNRCDIKSSPILFLHIPTQNKVLLMTEELKATAVFVCGLNPHMITRLDDITSIRAGGMFVPALHSRARLPDGIREYEVDFPIFVADTDTTERFEKIRADFHMRVDRSFDAYIEKWKEAKAAAEAKDAKKVVKLERKESEEPAGMDSGD